MKNIKVILLGLICLFLSVSASAQIAKDTIVGQVNELVIDAMAKGVFSGAIIIMKDGKPLFKTQAGYTDWISKKPITDSTLYNIGSLTKLFTQEMIRQLVKESKLEYDAPLNRYINLFPGTTGDKITVSQLLNMRSGLGDYFASPEFHRIEQTDFKLSDILNIIKKEPLWFEPGTDQRYSNSGYAVLGAVIEQVTGKSYEENLRARIAAPLKLNDIYYTKAEKESQHNRAFGHIVNFEGNKIEMDDISNSHPDGGIYTSLADLVTFTEAKRTHSMPSGYDYQPGAFAGGTPPWNSFINFSNDGFSYVIICNVGESADRIGPRIGSILRGEKYTPLSLPFQVTLYKMINEKGIDYIEQNIQELCRQERKPYDDRFLNFYGYGFLTGGRADLAIKILTLNTKLFPKIPNAYDSLAEAYLNIGDKQNALKCYSKILTLDPGNERIKNTVKSIGN